MPEEPKLSDVFVAFREQCIWLQICFNTYKELYESGDEVQKVLKDSAGRFFEDLNSILIEYCRLQICKLTDPATTGNKQNLTVAQINQRIQSAGLMNDQIEALSKGMEDYRKLIEDSRNQLISHHDMNSILKNSALGAHDPGDVSKVFDCLHEYIDAVGNAIGVGPLDFWTIPGAGDALDLLRCLRAGLRSSLQ